MGRRYSVATYLRRVEKAAGFNVTCDVIVGFPDEDDAAFANTVQTVKAAGITKVHVFPYSPRPGTSTAEDDRVSPAVKKERSATLRAVSAAACRLRWEAKIGTSDLVLVDRPGRGYGDDYTPWLVDAPVGALVRARAVSVEEEGVAGVPL
jgi:threonylcarbamoyladenosine tRNA methylthiotransferase MtaB